MPTRTRPRRWSRNLTVSSRRASELVAGHGLEKIKTIGDAFMATANLLQGHADPVLASVRCAFALIEAAGDQPARPGSFGSASTSARWSRAWSGATKFSFDLWGDTVNVAARLSTLGADAAIYLSADAWAQVAGRCRGEPLGPVSVKGKGEIEVYRCTGTLPEHAR